MGEPGSGIFCLEGEWESKLTDRASVEPLLRLLENLGHWGPVIHKDVATRDEFQYYTTKWLKKQYNAFRLAYFSFHGSPGSIHLGSQKITLAQVAEMLQDAAKDRIVYFGSCETLAVPDEDLQGFCKVTGARAVVGYTHALDWVDSAAFDVLLIPRLLDAKQIKPVYTSLCKKHPQFVTALGFRMATQNWCTPKKIRVDIVRQRCHAPGAALRSH